MLKAGGERRSLRPCVGPSPCSRLNHPQSCMLRHPRVQSQVEGAARASYQRNCADCHGANVDDGTAPPLRGAAFLGKYAGKPAADLFTYVSTKMPPANPGSLAGAEVAQIIAYVLQQSSFATGRR